MKNNKGFTLVELMAVIVVLAIIISIAIPSAISISRKVKENMYETKVDMILSSAKIYGQDHPGNVGNSEGECLAISIQTLIDEGYIKKDKDGYVQNPIDNSSMNELQVCIYKNNNRFYAKKYNTQNNLWEENAEIDGGSCSNVGDTNGNKICAPKNWSSCAKIVSTSGSGGMYHKIPVTANNVAILTKFKDNLQSYMVVSFDEDISDCFYIPQEIYNTILNNKGLKTNGPESKGGTYWSIDFSDCNNDLEWT